MKTFERTIETTALQEAKIPYLDQPELSVHQKDRLWRQLLTEARLPFLTRWILYRSLRTSTFWS